ncbi:MAG: ORF6N domain-containing protein [Selenomonadaceae bacterium]|nr:ORF6N domain-containing protein [Selenomonadaceae bacterium]
MENFKTPVPVEWSNQRVLTTAQLAEYYECAVKQIQQNFNKNKDRFVAGKHFFKLEGDSLEKLRSDLQFDKIESQNLQVDEIDLQISSKTRTLYLWTERGAARHAKMLSTDNAWEVFEMLEDNYFNHVIATKPVPAPPDVEKVVHPRSPTASVYAFFLSNDLVKIGHSDNIRERVNGVETRNKLTVKKIHFTADVARSIARFVEWACQKHFSSHRVKGEFFNIDFDEACKVIDSLMKIKTENNDKILKIVNMMNELSENQIEERTLLKMVANFYADRLFE